MLSLQDEENQETTSASVSAPSFSSTPKLNLCVRPIFVGKKYDENLRAFDQSVINNTVYFLPKEFAPYSSQEQEVFRVEIQAMTLDNVEMLNWSLIHESQFSEVVSAIINDQGELTKEQLDEATCEYIPSLSIPCLDFIRKDPNNPGFNIRSSSRLMKLSLHVSNSSYMKVGFEPDWVTTFRHFKAEYEKFLQKLSKAKGKDQEKALTQHFLEGPEIISVEHLGWSGTLAPAKRSGRILASSLTKNHGLPASEPLFFLLILAQFSPAFSSKSVHYSFARSTAIILSQYMNLEDGRPTDQTRAFNTVVTLNLIKNLRDYWTLELARIMAEESLIALTKSKVKSATKTSS